LTVAQIIDVEGVKRKIFEPKSYTASFAGLVFNELLEFDIDYLVEMDGSLGP